MNNRLKFVLVPVVTALALIAAKPAPVESSITLDQVAPSYGNEITFTVVTPKTNETLRVRVLCYQDDVLVYQYAGDPAVRFHLTSQLWQSGGANCSADLYYFTYKGKTQTDVVYLANTEFEVLP